MKKPDPRKFEISLEDLIAAAGEIAFEHSNNDREAYNLARLALIEILRKTSDTPDFDSEFETTDSSSDLVH